MVVTRAVQATGRVFVVGMRDPWGFHLTEDASGSSKTPPRARIRPKTPTPPDFGGLWCAESAPRSTEHTHSGAQGPLLDPRRPYFHRVRRPGRRLESTCTRGGEGHLGGQNRADLGRWEATLSRRSPTTPRTKEHHEEKCPTTAVGTGNLTLQPGCTWAAERGRSMC